MDAADTDIPPLQSLLRGAEHRQNLCVVALLTWVASCDGTIHEEELQLLRNVAAGVAGGEAVLPAVVDVARLGRADDLEFACRYLRNHAGRADRPLLAQLFVTMAAQDGHLTVAENHVLRFLADLLGFSARRFAKLFQQVTGRPFPEVGDVSSPEWWRRREAGEQASAPADGWGETGRVGARARRPQGPSRGAETPPPATPAANGQMTPEAARRMFGVDEGASPETIHAVYRRLAKARHPDRYARLGPAAQATATVAFTRLQEAYALLSA